MILNSWTELFVDFYSFGTGYRYDLDTFCYYFSRFRYLPRGNSARLLRIFNWFFDKIIRSSDIIIFDFNYLFVHLKFWFERDYISHFAKIKYFSDVLIEVYY